MSDQIDHLRGHTIDMSTPSPGPNYDIQKLTQERMVYRTIHSIDTTRCLSLLTHEQIRQVLADDYSYGLDPNDGRARFMYTVPTMVWVHGSRGYDRNLWLVACTPIAGYDFSSDRETNEAAQLRGEQIGGKYYVLVDPDVRTYRETASGRWLQGITPVYGREQTHGPFHEVHMVAFPDGRVEAVNFDANLEATIFTYPAPPTS